MTARQLLLAVREGARTAHHRLRTSDEREHATVGLRADSARLAAVVQAQQDIAAAGFDLAAVCTVACQAAAELTGADGVLIELSEGDELVVCAGTGEAAGLTGMRLAVDGSLAGRCLQSGQVLVADDTAFDARVDERARPGSGGPRSMAVVPLFANREPVGVLKVLSRRAHAFDGLAVHTVELLATAMASAMAQGAAFAAQQRLLDERAEVEERLRDSERRLVDFLDNSDEVAYLKDLEGRYIFANRRLSENIGVPSADMLGKSNAELLSPAAAARFDALDERVVTTRRPHEQEDRVVLADGVHTFLSKRFPVRAGSGDTYAIGCVATDITARTRSDTLKEEALDELRLANAALAEAEARQAAVLAALEEAVVVVGGDSVVLLANASAQRLLGAEVGGRFRDALMADGRALVDGDGRPMGPGQSPSAAARTSGRPQIDQVLGVVDPDGTTRWLSVNALPLFRAGEAAAHASVVSCTDITARVEAESLLREQALHDHLTGLPNRHVLADRLEVALARAARNATTIGVLFVDLDRLKVVNDNFGHEGGDELLVQVAARLRALVRPTDTVARIGGDEFVVVCEDLYGQNDAVMLAERILADFSEPFVVGGTLQAVSASIGIALSDAESTAERLWRDSDTAMYQAKEGGRSQYRIFTQELAIAAVGRMNVEAGLRRALEHDELVLHYQPVVDLRSGHVLGMEALVRWVDPERGIVMPGEFIEVAEQSGLIVALGAWVLERACHDAATWPRRDDGPPIRVAVNVSGRQLCGRDFVAGVRAVLDRSGIEPSSLCLELTESVFIDASPAIAEVFAELRELGVVLSIDDFGTGYSSLSYLRRFPVHIVKIDRSFVSGLGVHREDEAIVEAVLALGRAFGMFVVAEGVETEEQAAILRSMGCPLGQGFLWACPGEADDVLGLARSTSAASGRR